MEYTRIHHTVLPSRQPRQLSFAALDVHGKEKCLGLNFFGDAPAAQLNQVSAYTELNFKTSLYPVKLSTELEARVPVLQSCFGSKKKAKKLPVTLSSPLFPLLFLHI